MLTIELEWLIHFELKSHLIVTLTFYMSFINNKPCHTQFKASCLIKNGLTNLF